jgi:hypothetical protein
VLLELVGTQLTVLVRNDLINIAVSHEDRYLLVRVVRGDHLLDLLLQEQVAAQTEDATQLLLVCDSRQQCHGASLREASNDDAVGGDALCHFLVDEGVEVLAGLDDACFISLTLGQAVEGLDVVPARHAHAHVLPAVLANVLEMRVGRCAEWVARCTHEGNGNAGRIWEDEFDFFKLASSSPVLGKEDPTD